MKKTVHIVIEDGFISDAYADFDVDVVVYDLGCQSQEERDCVVKELDKVKHLPNVNVVDVY